MELKLRVWWNRNGKQTTYKANDVEDAKRIINILSNNDLNNPLVTWNAGGLEVFEDGEWCEWYSEEGLDIKEIMDNEDEVIA